MELRCTYDPESKSGSSMDGRKVKGTLHWLSVDHAQPAEVRLYNHLFLNENPADEKEYPELGAGVNPDSLGDSSGRFHRTIFKRCGGGRPVPVFTAGAIFVSTMKSSTPGAPVF